VQFNKPNLLFPPHGNYIPQYIQFESSFHVRCYTFIKLEKEAEETRKEGGRGRGRKEEGLTIFQVYSDSRQDLHFNIH